MNKAQKSIWDKIEMPKYCWLTALAIFIAAAFKIWLLVTTHHPALDKYIRVQFRQAGVSWDEAKIGDFQVFYGLSKLIRPEEIGLGVTTP
jgi:hypothetical protein